MTIFDFAVLGVVILSGFFAYSRGLVREALSIAAWINASFVALYSFPYVVPLFERVLPKGVIANGAAAAVVFILALMVLHMISSALARRVKGSSLSQVDRTFGLIFGLARGLILVCVGYIALAWMLPPGKDRPSWFADARSIPYLDAGAAKLRSFVPLPHSASAPRTANASAASTSTSVEKEAESAINAFRKPSANAAPPANAAPAYTPDEQRGLNRLIQQQNSK
ncbi:MAG TPA: CvpA family protein [Stellaceae bacterium]|jgi:membrane protein required for colicin V production|nr:CvpA family protein [Stellaceae bacterium]